METPTLLSPFAGMSPGEDPVPLPGAAASEAIGLLERRSPYVECCPIHVLCCWLAAMIVWLMSSLFLYLTADYEVQYIKRQAMGVRICGLALVASLLVLFIFPFKSQSLFSNIVRGLLTIFAVAWGMFVDEHVAIRWLHMISTAGILVLDTYSVALQADLLDCQIEETCSTGDPQWLLMVSFVRQYVAITFELLSMLFALYPIQTLGCFTNTLLPEDYGIPRHLRELAKATITRKKLEARDPKLFDKGKIHQLFDPKEPLEVKWDAFADALLGNKRKSWPISKNRRRLSVVSSVEMQRRLEILARLNLPIDDYLEMRKELELERGGTDEFDVPRAQMSLESDASMQGEKKTN